LELRQTLRVEVVVTERSFDRQASFLPAGQLGDEPAARPSFDADAETFFQRGNRQQYAVARRNELQVDRAGAVAPAKEDRTRSACQVDASISIQCVHELAQQ